ncbi:Alpha/Beta hydrolase protein [Hyaloraphidium curvatum]|nr:Alpha/Beta hydrolase protein [Hyaloraphidium curvatum]
MRLPDVRLYPDRPVPPGPPPGDLHLAEPAPHVIRRNVSDPLLTPHLPDPAAANGTGIVICPGGAHHFLAVDHEGHAVAEWLVSRGFAAFVLQYRVIPTADDEPTFLVQREQIVERLGTLLAAHFPLAVEDGLASLELARSLAPETRHLGILGFSAGAHLAHAVSLAIPARVDFVCPVYGALWGPEPPVPEPPMPMLTAVATDDPISLEPCLALHKAWRRAGGAAEMHVYSKGGHGFGMFRLGRPCDAWIERMGEFLAAHGFAGEGAAPRM